MIISKQSLSDIYSQTCTMVSGPDLDLIQTLFMVKVAIYNKIHIISNIIFNV